MDFIGQRMKKIRIDLGISVNEAAQKAQIPVSTYREWEAGRKIKGEPYEKIARALEVTLYELLTGQRPKYREVLAKIEEIENNCKVLKKSVESFM